MDIAPLNEKTGYVRWMKSQGLPIHVGHGMADLRTLEVAPYARTGASRGQRRHVRRMKQEARRASMPDNQKRDKMRAAEAPKE